MLNKSRNDLILRVVKNLAPNIYAFVKDKISAMKVRTEVVTGPSLCFISKDS